MHLHLTQWVIIGPNNTLLRTACKDYNIDFHFFYFALKSAILKKFQIICETELWVLWSV